MSLSIYCVCDFQGNMSNSLVKKTFLSKLDADLTSTQVRDSDDLDSRFIRLLGISLSSDFVLHILWSLL